MSPVFNNNSINRNKRKAKEHQLELMDAPGGYCAKLWACVRWGGTEDSHGQFHRAAPAGSTDV